MSNLPATPLPTKTKFPERVLQFGTGILLRGLPDFFIDQANKKGTFNGAVVMVKSTEGESPDFGTGYNIFVRGIENGITVKEDIVNTSISRVISAKENWQDVLSLASNREINIIISNTTEVGLQYIPELIAQIPPVSFPGKLTAFLFGRFNALGDTATETVVIPTELIPDNAIKLKSIVGQLIEFNSLGDMFKLWLNEKVIFCNSLVDRIVTRPAAGVDPSDSQVNIQTEPFRMWAIEVDNRASRILAPMAIDNGLICQSDITYYRERKLRMLNGCHTIITPLAFLLGHDTVAQCMADQAFRAFAVEVLTSEIMPTVDGDGHDRSSFAKNVIERFSNPFLEHRLLSISFQSAMKMKVRDVPVMRRYVALFGVLPALMCRGFAAWLVFMKVVKKDGNYFFGQRGTQYYRIDDDSALWFFQLWKHHDVADVVRQACGNQVLWDFDLTTLPQFEETVLKEVRELLNV